MTEIICFTKLKRSMQSDNTVSVDTLQNEFFDANRVHGNRTMR